MDVVSITAEPDHDHLEKRGDKDDDEEVVLPGFRFHPTDEELVGFYLRRKVDNKPIKIELIKQIDIYKYDPWDLPSSKSSSLGEKEWYFFCIRGRKYRNSIRPNRVTGSGFWKATGIDKPIYCGGEPHECIGLKKSLVYYRGSAGKGTKTDWMMHEFRLPPYSNGSKRTHTAQPHVANTIQEAEVWTICRIFKRIPSYKKYTPNLKSRLAMTKQSQPSDSSSKTCSSESDNMKPQLNLEDSSAVIQKFESRQVIEQYYSCDVQRNHLDMTPPFSSIDQPSFAAAAPYGYTSSWNPTVDDVFVNGSWDELISVVQLATDPSSSYTTCL